MACWLTPSKAGKMTKSFLVLITVLLTSLAHAETPTQKEKSIIQKRQDKARQNQEANFDTNKLFMPRDKDIRTSKDKDASEEIQAQEKNPAFDLED